MEININDIVINYEKVGSGKPVIIMHGWGQNLEIMYSIVNNLKDNYLVYNIDLPGFGQSDEPNFAYTLDDYALFLEEFIKQNKVKDPIIIGHSFGCRVAIKYAIKNDNLDKLIFTGAAGIKDRHGILFYIRLYAYKFIKKFKDVPFIKHYIQEAMENSGSEDYKNSSPIMKEVLKNSINEDLSDVLNQIKVDTLLIYGSEDDATPLWMGEMMKARIKKSKLIVYEGASHFAYLEQIERFNKDVNDFLKDGDLSNG